MAAAAQHTPQTQHLQQTFDGALATVQDRSRALEHHVLRPALARGRELGGAYPVSATFLTVLAVLSVIPVLTFLSFVTVVLVSSLVTAAVVVSSIVGGSVVLGLLLLVPWLAVALSLAGGAVGALLAGFLALRLYAHLQTEPTLPSALGRTHTDLVHLVQPELSLLRQFLPPSSSSPSSSSSTSPLLPSTELAAERAQREAKAELEEAREVGREALDALREVKREIKREAGEEKVKGE